ncbi:MAG: hypothetical protein J0I41_16610 [Filimonas sp.]|nr:hypothetical protein [Filimonas sp.]
MLRQQDFCNFRVFRDDFILDSSYLNDTVGQAEISNKELLREDFFHHTGKSLRD